MNKPSISKTKIEAIEKLYSNGVTNKRGKNMKKKQLRARKFISNRGQFVSSPTTIWIKRNVKDRLLKYSMTHGNLPPSETIDMLLDLVLFIIK